MVEMVLVVVEVVEMVWVVVEVANEVQEWISVSSCSLQPMIK